MARSPRALDILLSQSLELNFFHLAWLPSSLTQGFFVPPGLYSFISFPFNEKKNLKYLSFFVVSLIYLTANYNGKKKHWNNVIRFYLKLNTPDFKVMRGNLNLKLKSNILVTLTVALKQFYRHRRVLNRRNLGRGIVFLVWFAQLHIDSLKGRLVTQKNLFSAYKIVSFALLINVIDWTHKTL